jgi:hypothetical protein
MLLAVHSASDRSTVLLYRSTGFSRTLFEYRRRLKDEVDVNYLFINVKGPSGAMSEAFYIHVCIRSALRTHSR